jgi:hypothetical protein
MKMTSTYMAETAAHFESRGFMLTLDSDDRYSKDGSLVFHRQRYILKRPLESIVMESLRYPDGRETFYLEFGWHAASFFSFQLDSWKHRADRVEFKFQPSNETGEGLALTVWLREDRAS